MRNQNKFVMDSGDGDDEDEEEEKKCSEIAVAVDKDKNSKYAVKWALDHLISKGGSQTLVMIHVRPPLLSIPTPMGNHVPITHVCEDAVALYMKEVKSQTDELLRPYLLICNSKKVQTEIRILENENISKAIVEHISNFNIRKIVMGSSSRNIITRRFMSPDVPASVAKIAPNFCTVYVVSKGKLSSLKSAVLKEQIRSNKVNITSDHNFQVPNVTDCICPLNGSDLREETDSEALMATVFHSGLSYRQGHQDIPVGNQVIVHDASNPSNADESADEKISVLQSPSIKIGSSFSTNSLAMSEQTHFPNILNTDRRIISDLSTGIGAPKENRLQSVAEISNPGNRRSLQTFKPAQVILHFLSEETTAMHCGASNEENTYFSSMSQSPIKNPNGAYCQYEKRSMGVLLPSLSSDSPLTLWEDTHPSPSSSSMSMQSQVRTELERVELELNQTRYLYNLACEEAIVAKQKAREIHTQRVDEVKILEATKVRQELTSAIVAVEKARCQAATKDAEAAMKTAETETSHRKLAEFIASRELEGKNVGEALVYRTYSIEEIESATDFFSESLKIGEGSYGSVYKCTLDQTTVAIKVLCPGASQGWKQFQREVEVLSHITHPHMVVLLGSCPEFGCLVYEYMANGSLEDRLFRRGATPSLPWPVRFRIASEVATGLLYLHSSKPNPHVHRDLKPANILLDHNFVSKIGDVGLAKLVPVDLSSSITHFRNTTTSGTFCYIDPEYQQTGTLGTKSDLYAFGVVLLQLLTAKTPMGLAYDVENAIDKGSFKQILDQTVKDWPVKEALYLAKLALKCVELRRRDRPDLETVVLPELQRLKAFADSQYGPRRRNSFGTPPKNLFCPILQVCTKGDTEEVVPMNIDSKERPSKLTYDNKLRHFYRKVFGS